MRETAMMAVMKSPVHPPRVAPAPSGATMHSVCLDCGYVMEMPTVPMAQTNRLRNAVQGRLNLPKIPAPLWNSIAAVENAYTVAGNATGEKIAWITQMRKTAPCPHADRMSSNVVTDLASMAAGSATTYMTAEI